MSKIKHFAQQSWLLVISAFFFGLLIAVTNAALSECIMQNEQDKLYNRMRRLIEDANDFEKVDQTDIYRAVDSGNNSVGFGFVAVGSGFADKIKLVIAVDAKCEKFFGFKVLSSNETVGFGSKIKDDYFGEQFRGVSIGVLRLVRTGDAGKIDSEIVAISGATVSSEAVVKIFNAYIVEIKGQLQEKGLISNVK
ncbi:MAG: FMN-binding protein [Planctomycetota bacterium]|jgi:electron transport complex protein RnfG